MGVTNLKDKLDTMCPVAKLSALGTKIDGLITLANELRRLFLYKCDNSAGLAIGSSSKAKILIANTVQFVNNGVRYTKTTAEVAFTATSHDITNSATTIQEAVYLVSLAANGTATITKGETATGSGNALVPDCPSGNTPIGYLRLAVEAGATPFDASSDDLDAAHLTDTYVDLPFQMDDLAVAITALV